MTKWKPGQSGNSDGRPKGSRNRFQKKWWDLLEEAYEKHGVNMFNVVAIEKPDVLLKIGASLMPKEFEFSHNKLEDDADLDELLESIRRRIAEKRSQLVDVTPPTEEVKVLVDDRKRDKEA